LNEGLSPRKGSPSCASSGLPDDAEQCEPERRRDLPLGHPLGMSGRRGIRDERPYIKLEKRSAGVR